MTDHEKLRAKFTESGVNFSVGIREEFCEAENLPEAAHTMIQTHSPISFWFGVSGEYTGAYHLQGDTPFRWESRFSDQEDALCSS